VQKGKQVELDVGGQIGGGVKIGAVGWGFHQLQQSFCNGQMLNAETMNQNLRAITGT
jgi:hypothetical protein